MNSKERVIQTLAHIEPDRVPFGEWGIDHDIVEKVIGRDTYWRNKKKVILALWSGKRDEVVESYKKDLVELTKKLDYDLVPVHLVPPAGLPPQKIEQTDENTWRDGRGQTWKYSQGNDAILLVDSPVKSFKSRDELREYFESELVKRFGFKIKNRTGNGYDMKLDDESRLDLVRHAVNQLGNEKFIIGRGFEEGVGNIDPLYLSEFEVAMVFFGGNLENFLLNIAMKPELVQEAFNLYTEINIAAAKAMIDAGVDAVMPGGDFSDSNGPMVSPESIRRIFLPGMKKLSTYCHQRGVRVMSHNCGNNWKIMDILIEAGYESWQSIACKTASMDLKRLKEEYGEKISFWGGINIETLVDGTPEENENDVLYALKYAAPGGGFIMGTSNSVCFGSKYENYMSALETLHKYGDYPIQL
ncbi:MAG: hypothetical protein JW957_05195 [Candidatus Omnitrophica bacterium]|nr:hypothetical protein [Candidatus Omnitrophota bacterium]